MDNAKYNSNQAFLDLLFCTLLGFMALFIIAFLSMSVEKKKKNVESKAEFLITVTWNKDSNDDVDSWLEDPEGHFIWFNRREDGFMFLDRDDIGKSNDRIETKFGPIEIKENREIVTLRGIVPGEYVFNLHMYRKDSPGPLKANVQIDKMNPYEIVFAKDITLNQSGEEKTVVRFTLDKKGDVTAINTIPKSLIKKRDQPPPQ